MVHGLTIPLGKLCFHLPATVSNALDTSGTDESEPLLYARGQPGRADQSRTYKSILTRETLLDTGRRWFMKGRDGRSSVQTN